MKLKKELKEGIFHKLYLFIGIDKALIKKRINRIASALDQSIPKLSVIEDESGWKNLIASLQERQLFSKTRLEAAELIFIPKQLGFKIAENNHLILISNKLIKFKLDDCYIEDTGRFGKTEYIKYINYFISHHKKSARGEVIEKIYENCGKDIARIESELLKLIAYIGKKNNIETSDLSILTKNPSKGWLNLYKKEEGFLHNDKLIKTFQSDGKPPQVISGIIFNSLIKKPNYLKEEKFNQALELLKQADIAIKRSDPSLGFIIIRQLLFKLNLLIRGIYPGQNFWEI